MPSEWDKGASSYANAFAAFTGKFATDAAQLLAERVTTANKNDTPLVIMDAAAGTGASTFALASALKATSNSPSTILATDISEGMLAVLQGDVPSHQSSSISINTAVMSLDSLVEQPDNSLDGLLCVFGIMFVPEGNAPKAAAAIKRVLKPGGTAIIVTWKDIRTTDIMSTAAVAQGIMKPEDKPNFLQKMLRFGGEKFMTDVFTAGDVDPSAITFVEVAHGHDGHDLLPLEDFVAMSQTNPAIAGAVAPHSYDVDFLASHLKDTGVAVTVDGKQYVPIHGTALVTAILKEE